jgi:hypothetical protein
MAINREDLGQPEESASRSQSQPQLSIHRVLEMIIQELIAYRASPDERCGLNDDGDELHPPGGELWHPDRVKDLTLCINQHCVSKHNVDFRMGVKRVDRRCNNMRTKIGIVRVEPSNYFARTLHERPI